MLRCMVDVVVGESSNCKIAMIVAVLVPKSQLLVVTRLFRSGHEILRKQLALLVEAVLCALEDR